MTPDPPPKPVRLAFPLIGGPHQVFHTAPVAAALSAAWPEASVAVLASDPRSLRLAERAAAFYPGARLQLDLLAPSAPGELAVRLTGKRAASKLPLLWRNRRRLQRFDAIVVPECTSVYLRRMGVGSPRLICIPHGAGDRAVSFEPRFRRFDRVLVAGGKTARRMIESGVPAERVETVGYPKAGLVRRMAARPPKLFENGRPVVLYNPHFRRSLSSLASARSILADFAAQDRFNLIFAPHIRASEEASPAERREWESLAVPGRIIVDLGSDRLVDMTYPAAAHIYLGDVSSQVYEFLLSPRPCVFVDAHSVDWRPDPDYAFWRLGEVASPAGALAAVARAPSRHGEYLAAQREAIAETFGDQTDPAARAARAIMREAVAGRRG